MPVEKPAFLLRKVCISIHDDSRGKTSEVINTLKQLLCSGSFVGFSDSESHGFMLMTDCKILMK